MFGRYIKKIKEAYCCLVGLPIQITELRSLQRQQYLLNHVLNDIEPGVSSKRYCSEEVIVSLTSYGRRLDDVCYAIESIMQQTYKPNRIVLWLDKKDFENSLPESLLMQQRRGLDIRVYEPDIRSYKKLIPSLKEFPNAAIITVDDDVMYDFDIVERLIKAYIADPKSVHACRIHQMTFNDQGEIRPYSQWNWCVNNLTEENRAFLTGVGGVLYPPNSLHLEVMQENIFKRICGTADDVWFTAMAIKNGTSICKVQTRSDRGEDYILNHSIQDMGLYQINTLGECKNDAQIKAVFTKYLI